MATITHHLRQHQGTHIEANSGKNVESLSQSVLNQFSTQTRMLQSMEQSVSDHSGNQTCKRPFCDELDKRIKAS